MSRSHRLVPDGTTIDANQPNRATFGALDQPSGPAPAAPLENIANNASPLERRRVRYARRALLWNASSLQRVRYCGRYLRSSAGGVELRLTDKSAGYAGLQHCGSVWACPVCSSRILTHRAVEIGQVLGAAIREGHQLGFVTLTMRHNKSQSLADLWKAAQKAWRRVTSGRGWQQGKAEMAGMVRVWEVTHGKNGWHVHVHCILVLEKGRNGKELEEIGSSMFKRWSAGLEAAGLEAPKRIGQDWHIVEGKNAAQEVGQYLAKMVDLGTSLGLELTHVQPGKTSEDLKTKPVWSLLDDVKRTGALDKWHEWERVSKGKRQVAWSPGLRERFAPNLEELDDDEIVDQELGDRTDTIAWWNAEQWAKFVQQPERMAELLDIAETSGKRAALERLDAWGVWYSKRPPSWTESEVERVFGRLGQWNDW